MAGAATVTGRARGRQQFDPFKSIYRLLTSVRFALLLLGTVVVAALLGVIFPQAADDVRAVPAAYDAFTQFQHGRYGVFTTPMRQLGLFEVFHSYWFNGLLLLLLVSVAVCTANRIPPIVRNVRRPVRRVNDRYFQNAHHRAEFATPADAGAVARELRRRRYRVEETQRDGATYLFADRFSWAQYGTFLSHLSLILFMSGAIVTKIVGFSTFIQIPDGRTYPVFPTIHAGQMQVENLRAADDENAAGLPTRYHSELAVFRDGRQICHGTSTVNDPMRCAGYTLHQTTFSGDGAELQIRDLSTNQVVYQEVTDVANQGSRAPSPHLVVRDRGGSVLFDDNLVLIPLDQNMQRMVEVITVPKPDGSTLPLAVLAIQQANGWSIKLYHPPGADAGDPAFATDVTPGHDAEAGGYDFSVPALSGIPLSVVTGVPGVKGQALLMQLGRSANGEAHLDLLDMGAPQDQNAQAQSDASGGQAPTARLDLQPNQPQTMNGYQFTFLGQRAITGITVRRDPGSTFIWVATALMMLGLAVTFYLPRRRLWAKITPERTYMAGVADRIVSFSNEMRRSGAAAGSADAAPLEADG
jgi:cytochrome c biogenesis protein ResB